MPWLVCLLAILGGMVLLVCYLVIGAIVATLARTIGVAVVVALVVAFVVVQVNKRRKGKRLPYEL